MTRLSDADRAMMQRIISLCSSTIDMQYGYENTIRILHNLLWLERLRLSSARRKKEDQEKRKDAAQKEPPCLTTQNTHQAP